MGAQDCLIALSEGTISPDAALQQARQALDEDHVAAEWAVPACLALWRLERHREAFELHRSYSHHLQNNGDAWLIAGACARKVPGLDQAAEQALLKGVTLLPTRWDAHYNLGNFYSDGDRYEEALLAYRHSLAIEANVATVWHNYGVALRELERLDAAATAMKRSIQLDPSNADVWCNLGLVAHAKEDFKLSKQLYLQSIQLDQNHSTGWVNVGMALLEEQKPEEALSMIQRGHQLNPKSPEALFNMALTLLLLGEYSEGWRLYESRFTTKQFKHTVIPSSGPWITSTEQLQQLCTNQTQCLVWSEQGIGDVIQFLRYLPVLQALKLPFVFATRKPLIPLIEAWGPPGLLVADETSLDDTLKTAPHLAQLSLPRLLRSDLDTIPSVTPYLTAPGPPPEALLVPPPPGGLAVGLVWASNPGNKGMYRLKSLPLNLLLPRLLPAVQENLIELHSLQVGDDSRELDPFRRIDGVMDWNGKLNNFSDTAHVVSQLDLVISVDTAVAHLAAALDLPTWVLLPSNADFRWLRERSDTPWYSSMRLFRQRNRNDWTSAIDAVMEALGEVLALDMTQLAEETR